MTFLVSLASSDSEVNKWTLYDAHIKGQLNIPEYETPQSVFIRLLGPVHYCIHKAASFEE